MVLTKSKKLLPTHPVAPLIQVVNIVSHISRIITLYLPCNYGQSIHINSITVRILPRWLGQKKGGSEPSSIMFVKRDATFRSK